MTARVDETHRFVVTGDVDERLDVWVAERLAISRSQVKNLVDRGLIKVNGLLMKAGYRVQVDDEVLVSMPATEVAVLEPEPIPVEIVYEDRELAIVNKPKGLVVHPGVGNLDGTLVNALLYHLDELGEGDDAERPGIVHRLDKDTSGLMMIAKTDSSYAYLTRRLQERQVERHYVALVQGVVSASEGLIDQPIGRHPRDRTKRAVITTGREAQTAFTVLERFQKHSLVLCKLVTGRPHQIRVHFASLHHPVVGDPLYGFRTNNLGAKSQVLHASYLAFTHPQGHFVEFHSEPDPEFLHFVEKARKVN